MRRKVGKASKSSDFFTVGTDFFTVISYRILHSCLGLITLILTNYSRETLPCILLLHQIQKTSLQLVCKLVPGFEKVAGDLIIS